MNNFHIYEPVGRGKQSAVYKGRKKRSLEYVAIKSTDRNQKARVLQEVKVMHTIKHPNVLGFHAWYETTNHLWLILEFCVGGDLASLLRADRQLPEATVLRFGRDVAAGLQALHAAGVVHCDLCPANLLLDENGRVKLGGFAASRRAGDLASTLGVPPARQGAPGGLPYYTAPELLAGGGGVPSTASDLWSLGCILYECAAGRPPFVASSLPSLTQLVQTAEPAPLIGTSAEFQDLVARLLDRNPGSRLGWEELCGHAFWGASPLEPRAVPAGITPARGAGSLDSLPAEAPPPHLHHTTSAGMGLSDSDRHAAAAAAAAAAQQELIDVSPPRIQTRCGSSDEGGSEDGGPTPLHPSSRQRLPEEQPTQEPARTGSEPLDPVAPLIWHPTDLAMKPIVGNRRIERPMEAAYAPSLLPFKPLSAQELLASPPAPRVAFVQSLQRVLAGSAHQHTKLALLCYLESLSHDGAAAHELMNSELCAFMVRMLQHSSSAALRARLVHVIGLLIRHSSVISEALAQAGLVDVLAGGMQDADLDVQRRCTAALGELLFYVASQSRAAAVAGGSGGGWAAAGAAVEGLVRTLTEGGRDEVVQHYAVKTIENIAGQAGPWALKFATPDVVTVLTEIVSGSGRAAQYTDGFRGTAASALVRLLRFKPTLLAGFLDAGGMRIVSKGMVDPSPRVQQAAVTMLCLLCSHPASSQRAVAAVEKAPTLMRVLGVILEHPVDVIKAKGVLASALLCRSEPALLGELVSGGVLARCEKAAREQSGYLNSAAAALRGALAAAMPALLMQVSSSLQSLQQQRAGSAAPAQPLPPQMQTLLYLLGSPSYREVAVSEALIVALADLLTRATSSTAAWSGLHDVKESLLQAVDSICCHPELLLQHHQPVLEQLLPALSAAVASPKESSDTRFVCLKLLCDIVLQLITEYPPGGAEPEGPGALLDSAVSQYVLPLAPALLEEEDPMPLYALKLLGILLELNPGWVAQLVELGLATRFFEWLSIEASFNNVHNIRICRLIAQSGTLPAEQLVELGVMDRALAVLSYSNEYSVDPFLEPSLELCLALLEVFSRRPTGASETGKLLPALPLLLDLCLHVDAGVAAASAACIAGVSQLHPEDAAAILAQDNVSLPALLAATLQPGEGQLNELAAFHLLHAAALAARQPAFQRRREAFDALALAARQVLHCSGCDGLKQAASEALAVLKG